MSKFAEKIRRTSYTEPQPLGFITSRSKEDATVLLAGIARDPRGAAELVRAGADAVIVVAAGSPPAAPEAGTVAGAWIERGNDAKTLREAGYDFVVFDPDKTPSTAVLDEQAGYVLVLAEPMGDTELRAVDAFSLDAVDVGELKGALTVRKQIELRRIAALTRKPLMATVSADISVDALQALRDGSVAVVCVEGAANVERLRKTIDALPPRARRREDPDRPTPLVPRSAAGTGEEHDHDDDD